MSETPKLLPCPFCGGEAREGVVQPGGDDDSAYYEVGCIMCCFGLCSRTERPDLAIAAWSRRADSALAARHEALRSACDAVLKPMHPSNIIEVADVVDDMLAELGDGYLCPGETASLREVADALDALRATLEADK